jgi:hypothetical protein
MCPDRKLKWFKDHGRTSAQIRDIKKLVVNRFKESYAAAESSDAHEESAPAVLLLLSYKLLLTNFLLAKE